MAVRQTNPSTAQMGIAVMTSSAASVRLQGYACDLYTPFLCADLSCVQNPYSCPVNNLSYTIQPVSNIISISENNAIDVVIDAKSEVDSNIKAVELRITPSRLFYSPYTAQYSIITKSSTLKQNIKIKLEPVPLSFAANSRIKEDAYNLEDNKISSTIFQKPISDMKPHQFIRSTIINLYIEDYQYNDYITRPFSIKFAYNSIRNYPDYVAT